MFSTLTWTILAPTAAFLIFAVLPSLLYRYIKGLRLSKATHVKIITAFAWSSEMAQMFLAGSGLFSATLAALTFLEPNVSVGITGLHSYTTACVIFSGVATLHVAGIHAVDWIDTALHRAHSESEHCVKAFMLLRAATASRRARQRSFLPHDPRRRFPTEEVGAVASPTNRTTATPVRPRRASSDCTPLPCMTAAQILNASAKTPERSRRYSEPAPETQSMSRRPTGADVTNQTPLLSMRSGVSPKASKSNLLLGDRCEAFPARSEDQTRDMIDCEVIPAPSLPRRAVSVKERVKLFEAL